MERACGSPLACNLYVPDQWTREEHHSNCSPGGQLPCRPAKPHFGGTPARQRAKEVSQLALVFASSLLTIPAIVIRLIQFLSIVNIHRPPPPRSFTRVATCLDQPPCGHFRLYPPSRWRAWSAAIARSFHEWTCNLATSVVKKEKDQTFNIDSDF